MTYITKSRMLYALYTAVIGALVFFLYNSLILLAVCLFLSFNIFAMLLAVYTKRAGKKLGKPLYEDCDPETYIKTYGALLAKHPKQYFLYIILNSGLLAAGRNSEAAENLRRIPAKWIESKKYRKAFYERESFAVHLQLNELEEAGHSLARFKELLDVLGKTRRKAMLLQYELDERVFNMTQGDYRDMGPFFRGLFERSETNLERVFAKYKLGKIYMHEGDKQRAQIAFDYVLSRGNKLYVVEKARELIQSMKESCQQEI